MRIDKLTTQLQTALADAQSLAVGQNNTQIEPVHLLWVLLNQENGTTPHLLRTAKINLVKLRERLKILLDDLPTVQQVTGETGVSNNLSKLFNIADKLIAEYNDQFVSS